MLFRNQKPSSSLSWLFGFIGALLASILVFSASIHTATPFIILGAACFCLFFFLKLEQAVLIVLILRSAIDIFSAQQVPAIYAVGLDILALAYIVLMMATGQRVYTDRFFWVFAGWIGLQSLWVILIPMGGLGMGGDHFIISLTEWVRLFSWLIVYLLVLQLKHLMRPQAAVNALFLSLVLPLSAAFLQICLPSSALPDFLAHRGNAYTDIAEATRINGTLGHPNALATFLVLFLGLTYWKLGHSKRRWPWLILMGIIALFIVSTKALVGLVMMGVLVVGLVLPRLTIPKLIGSSVLLMLVIFLFGSTEFGRERLMLFTEMPFFNDNLDISRAILMRRLTTNSFYWRLEQWSMLLDAWRQYPWLGYGFDSSRYLTNFTNAAHNDYIRALVESGIVGLLTFLGFLGGTAVYLIKKVSYQLTTPSQADLAITLLAFLLSAMVGMLTENVWSHTALFFYWFSLLSILNWNWNRTKESYVQS